MIESGASIVIKSFQPFAGAKNMTVYAVLVGVFLGLTSMVSVANPREDIPVFFDMATWEKERLTAAIDADFMTSEVLAQLVGPEGEFLGYIGSDYYRLHIGFTEVHPVEEAEARVLVSGYLRKGALHCNLEGTIHVEHSHDLKRLDYGVDNEYRNSGISRQGIVFGSFSLKTMGAENCAGTLRGRHRVTWMLMENGSITRNDVGNDRYLRGDNLYAGVWMRELSDYALDANWGEFRIPFARPELDIGAAEFSVNPEYLDYGWQ
ncbi:hypothetical protein [Marinobacter xestospongiae]|uniref:Uncharacterized protein n=1 Tax=Marinobacter xestospongiae TaxID=994319 RepID=A0ABU3VWV1_9GAMM|nr:hypothetical protein [Marinobacter xestospongiae]MDV2078216.1 hypothetical protein [Marinobacter xestospongiae]